MNGTIKPQILIDEIKKNRSILDELFNTYEEACREDLPLIGRKNTAALLIAGFLENYYTCAETIFLRISQFFENSLSPEKWHADLLSKMTLTIKGVREKVIGEETYGLLFELLKFRHFKRYYFQMNWDWDKIEFLQKKLQQVHPALKKELDTFIEFLERI
jgi:hypothetical protein